MNGTHRPPIVQAAETENIYEAAKQYAALELSVIPLQGKRPALKSWKQYQKDRASSQEIEHWHQQGLLENVGIVCGNVSGNLVVLDLDGAAGYPAAPPSRAATQTTANRHGTESTLGAQAGCPVLVAMSILRRPVAAHVRSGSRHRAGRPAEGRLRAFACSGIQAGIFVRRARLAGYR